jgi:glutaconate CoA-transferase subunit B
VERVDFVTSVGYGGGPGDRERLRLRGAGPVLVITDLGVLEPDPRTRELTLTRLHPGVGAEQAREATGWDLAVSGKVETSPPPTPAELDTLRALEGATSPSGATARLQVAARQLGSGLALEPPDPGRRP